MAPALILNHTNDVLSFSEKDSSIPMYVHVSDVSLVLYLVLCTLKLSVWLPPLKIQTFGWISVYENKLSVVTDCESHLRRVWKTYLLFDCVKYMCSTICLVQKKYTLSGLSQLLKRIGIDMQTRKDTSLHILPCSCQWWLKSSAGLQTDKALKPHLFIPHFHAATWPP
jgi:hypothetical protein